MALSLCQLKHYITTYPNLLLSDLSDLLGPNVHYRESSFLQYYALDGGTLVSLIFQSLSTLLIQSSFNCFPLLLNPSWDCPGSKTNCICSHVEQQVSSWIDLVSPPRRFCTMLRKVISTQQDLKTHKKLKDLIEFPSPLESPDIHPIVTTQSKSQKSKANLALHFFPLNLPAKSRISRASFKVYCMALWFLYFRGSLLVWLWYLLRWMLEWHKQDVFLQVFLGAKYHKGQIANVRTILSHMGEKLKIYYSRYGQGTKRSMEFLQEVFCPHNLWQEFCRWGWDYKT